MDRVDQAIGDPCEVDELEEPQAYSHGGEVGLNATDSDNFRRSLLLGAVVYEYWLYGSVLPPYTKSKSFTRAVAWPHLNRAD